MSEVLEYWLRGSIDGVPALLQPVAHALLQARDEIVKVVDQLPAGKLWAQPNGLASVGFHLQHISGVLDRLFTYAKGDPLSPEQLGYLAREGKTEEMLPDLLQRLTNQIDRSIDYLKTLDPVSLTDSRGVGRKQLPSTVIGLLFHSAEHTMRHTGQLLVTAKMV